MTNDHSEDHVSLIEKIKRKLIGAPRDLRDSSIFHKISLIPVLAWIGLGADGLSSSAYGPEEAFRALGEHTYLALFLALATALTVFIISYAYSRIIEHFPTGGGGYIVATHTLGEKAGVVSGCALLVDYMLTITVSIASCGDALFSFLPMHLHPYKLSFEIFLILVLIVLNLRGVKESVTVLAPIFVIFILTHALMLGYGIFSHLSEVGADRPRIPWKSAERHCELWEDWASSFFSFIRILLGEELTRGSRRCPTDSRSCETPRFTRAKEQCSTCRPLWPSPQVASSSATSF